MDRLDGPSPTSVVLVTSGSIFVTGWHHVCKAFTEADQNPHPSPAFEKGLLFRLKLSALYSSYYLFFVQPLKIFQRIQRWMIAIQSD